MEDNFDFLISPSYRDPPAAPMKTYILGTVWYTQFCIETPGRA